MRGKRARLGHGTLMVPVKQGEERRGGLYSAAAPQWADTGERCRHTATSLPHILTPLIGAEMAAVRHAISTGDDPQT